MVVPTGCRRKSGHDPADERRGVHEHVALAVPIHLASIDRDGFPHVTPLWFEWDASAFWMTSLAEAPHIRRLRANPNASVCLDIEREERADGERPNQQVRAVGCADLFEDADGQRTRRITERYLVGPGRPAMVERRSAAPRIAIKLVPLRLVAVVSV